MLNNLKILFANYLMRMQSALQFAVAGAIGGLLGGVINEFFISSEGVDASIWSSAYYFALFAAGVGFALGCVEGLVLRKLKMAIHGAMVGLILGIFFGAIGGVLGQIIFSLNPPLYSNAVEHDFVIAIDSSGSMFESDFWDKRKQAAKNLIDNLNVRHRVALVDFDEQAKVLFPLADVSEQWQRSKAKEAVNLIDSRGGTNLSLAIDTSLEQLRWKNTSKRRQSIVLLTDGAGQYDLKLTNIAKRDGISIYVIGLGSGVDPRVLKQMATREDHYYPVTQASALVNTFDSIFKRVTAVTELVKGTQGDAVLISSSLGLFIVRVISWVVIGLMIGLGQGLRENKPDELLWCSVGGSIGGLIGGIVFEFLSMMVAVAVISRILADIVVGFCIGGLMRVTQQTMVPIIDISEPHEDTNLATSQEQNSSKAPSRKLLSFMPTKEDFMDK